MTGDKSVFSELDSGIHGIVKFGDGSIVEIEGCGTILFVGKGGKHHKLTDVYFISRHKANIVSLGQLEVGCHIFIERGLLRIRDDRTTAAHASSVQGKPPLHPRVGDRATSQPLGQDERGILEVARKVRAPKLSCSKKITQGGDGAWFADNQRREQVVRRVPHRQIEAHPLFVSGILPHR